MKLVNKYFSVKKKDDLTEQEKQNIQALNQQTQIQIQQLQQAVLAGNKQQGEKWKKMMKNFQKNSRAGLKELEEKAEKEKEKSKKEQEKREEAEKKVSELTKQKQEVERKASQIEGEKIALEKLKRDNQIGEEEYSKRLGIIEKRHKEEQEQVDSLTALLSKCQNDIRNHQEREQEAEERISNYQNHIGTLKDEINNLATQFTDFSSQAGIGINIPPINISGNPILPQTVDNNQQPWYKSKWTKWGGIGILIVIALMIILKLLNSIVSLLTRIF